VSQKVVGRPSQIGDLGHKCARPNAPAKERAAIRSALSAAAGRSEAMSCEPTGRGGAADRLDMRVRGLAPASLFAKPVLCGSGSPRVKDLSEKPSGQLIDRPHDRIASCRPPKRRQIPTRFATGAHREG
jgi:hypothetical protein